MTEILDPALIGVVATHTQAPLTFIVRDADGDDSNDGLTELTPLKTLPAAIAKAPAHADHPVKFRLGDGSYVLPSFTRSLAAPFAFVGDGAGVGDGFTETQAAELADTGTSASQVVKVGGGLTPDAFIGQTLEVTAGPGAGGRALIKKNTATAFTFAKNLAVAPDNTSTYRLVRPTVTLTFGDIEIVAPSVPAGGFGGSSGTAPALAFAQVKLAASGFLKQIAINAVAVYYGVELDTANPFVLQSSLPQFYGIENLYATGGYPTALFGAAADSDWHGWGVHSFGAGIYPAVGEYVATSGYLVASHVVNVGVGAYFTLNGGRVVHSSANAAVIASFGSVFVVNDGEIENTGAGPAVESRDNAMTQLGNGVDLIAPTGALLRTRRGGQINAAAITGTAGGLVASAEGGQIYFTAAPSIDGASPGSDYSAGISTPAVAGKAAFAANGGGIASADGSLIVRNN